MVRRKVRAVTEQAGFGAYYTVVTTKKPPTEYGGHSSGPYIKPSKPTLSGSFLKLQGVQDKLLEAP